MLGLACGTVLLAGINKKHAFVVNWSLSPMLLCQCNSHEIYVPGSAFLYTASAEKLTRFAGNQATHILQCSHFSSSLVRCLCF